MLQPIIRLEGVHERSELSVEVRRRVALHVIEPARYATAEWARDGAPSILELRKGINEGGDLSFQEGGDVHVLQSLTRWPLPYQ